MLPSVSRVRIEVGRDWALVLQDIRLPRGDWQKGGLDLFVAFGAPGTPTAIDSILLSDSAGRDGTTGSGDVEAISVDLAPRALPSVNDLLGYGGMAGAVLHVRESMLRRAFSAGEAAIVRIRTLLSTRTADPSGARDVVVRLGAPDGVPLTLQTIEMVSLDRDRPFVRLEAQLCGREADERPLAIVGWPSASTASAGHPAAIEPSQAVRHGSDNLCVRWWIP
jgi:hypothetical protein